MRRLAPLLAVATLLVLAIVIATYGQDSEPPPRAGGGPVADNADIAAAASADVGAVAGVGVAPSEQRELAERTVQVVPPPTTSSLTVIVIDGDTGNTVANAEVTAVGMRALTSALAEAQATMHGPLGRRLRTALAHHGTTDTRGEAVLAVPDGPLIVDARSGLRWGFAVVNTRLDDGVTITIGPDRNLRVQVLDDRGQPRAGVPVALRRQTSAPPRQRFSYQATASEPPDGIATFLHYQRRLRQGGGWHATFAFPVRGEPAVAVGAETPAAPPRSLQLPPTGGLRIVLRDAVDEVPDVARIRVEITAFAGGAPLWSGGPWASPRIDPTSGEALVPWLGLGLELDVRIQRGTHILLRRELPGPTSPGEIVECLLLLEPLAEPAIARGRFVMNDGTPWPACKVRALARLKPHPHDAPRSRELSVDEGGRFALAVERNRPTNGSRSYLFRAPHPEGSGTVATLMPLDLDVPSAGIELGDVVLDHGPLLLAGTVLGPDRQPLANARVTLLAHTVALGDEMWPHVPTSGIHQTGDDGRFRLFLRRGDNDSGSRLRLRTTCADHVTAGPDDVARGDEQAIVVLQRAGDIAGSFALGEGLNRDDLLVVLRAEPAGRIHAVRVRTDGSFEGEDLAAGFYTLKVRRRGVDNRPEKEPVVVVEGLRVLPSDTCRDPRIQQLPIEALCSTLHVTVVDRKSTPLPHANVAIVGLRNARPVTADEKGVCRVRTRSLPVELEVVAFGCRPRRLSGVVGDQLVMLDDGLAVRLRAGARPAGRDPAYKLGVYVYDVDRDGNARRMTFGESYPWQYRYFDLAGELALRLPGPGVYECRPMLYVSGKDHVGRGAQVRMQARPRITVLDGIEQQTFELGIPQSAVDEAALRASR